MIMNLRIYIDSAISVSDRKLYSLEAILPILVVEMMAKWGFL